MIPILLDKAVLFHTRRGLRPGCDCDYCDVKHRATWEVGTEGKRFRPVQTLPIACLEHCCEPSCTHSAIYVHRFVQSDDWGYLLWLKRKELRYHWRTKLYLTKLEMCSAEMERVGQPIAKVMEKNIDQKTYNPRQRNGSGSHTGDWDRRAF